MNRDSLSEIYDRLGVYLGTINSGNIGRGFHFRKKGPGRRHNYSGIERRLRGMSINQEFNRRLILNRFSSNFIKRVRLDNKGISRKSLFRKFILKIINR